MAYAPAPICSPSRAGILLGRQIASTQYRDNFLPTQAFRDTDTFIHNLKAADYQAGYFGKWGLMGDPQYGPWFHGFDRFVGQLTNGDAHWVFPETVVDYNRSLNKQPPKTFRDISACCLRILPGNVGRSFNEENCPKDPNSTCTYVNDIVRDAFFDYLKSCNTTLARRFIAFWAPSYPHAARYIKGNLYVDYRSAVKRLSRPELFIHELTRGHAGQVEAHMDKDMGMFLDLMAEMPALDQRTFVIFTSDNGAHTEPNTYDPTWFITSGGLRDYKRSAYEGGMRVPTILRLPGKLRAGTVSRIPFALYDLAETFREAAGLPSKARPLVSGSSMWRAWLTGNEALAPSRTWLHGECCTHTDQTSTSCWTATYNISQWRKGRIYKLVHTPQVVELYELGSDPTEVNPLKDKALMRQMKKLRHSLRTKIVLPELP
jgi:arylsulfatase A